ncbi:hypothetical protein [uncultured Aureimonas sp.]|uniref:hypothetical protein n=1 Tax=uncultured Aureimonas sp. TaxID=1604662 RepID=UPI0025E9A40D|nr:hypothetical protein [uncultured Aureimonas sp.]
MRYLAPALLLALATVTGGAAHASSDDAWAAFDARVAKACREASGFQHARTSAIVGFDDRVGRVAMLVGDRAGKMPPKLCLYDKRAQKAYVDEAAGWSAPMTGR